MPGLRVMPAKTAAASAICGTHFALTNADTSMTGRSAALRRSTNEILSAVEIDACSFCRPSRGPTSTTVIRRPQKLAISIRPLASSLQPLLHHYQYLIRPDQLAFAATDRADRAIR